MTRLETKNELLGCEKEKYMELVHKLTQCGDSSIQLKTEVIPLEDLQRLALDIEELYKEYGV
jgi:hypothetical protein